jgi:hypothetical protein
MMITLLSVFYITSLAVGMAVGVCVQFVVGLMSNL